MSQPTSRFHTLLSTLAWFTLLALLAGCAPRPPAAVASPKQPAPACDAPVCAGMIVLQNGAPARVDLSAPVAAASRLVSPALAEISAGGRLLLDTGQPSPDGKWIAYTSISAESGGPVLLYSTSDGSWTNLIAAANRSLPAGQAPYPDTYLWDVIGWFPGSNRLLIGPSDLSLALAVDVPSGRAQALSFPGGGKGGRLFAGLSPDGKRMAFIGATPQGEQTLSTLELESGQVQVLLRRPYSQGVLYNPRYSPDQGQLAFLEQSGQPESGLSYAINLLSSGGAARQLVRGPLGLIVPVWSPDSSKIAYTRLDADQIPSLVPDATPLPAAENLWVVGLADGKQTQITFLHETLRSPVWAKDSQTLAYIGADGRAEMVSLAQPGKSWVLAGASQHPELSSFFFLP